MRNYFNKGKSTPLVFGLLLTFSNASFAKNENDLCWEEAGRRYSVDPLLLYSIAQVESNLQPNAFRDNGDTQDYGIMQINSWWLDQLAEYDIDKDRLFEPCVNINIGAWILNHSFGIYGHSWDAVGAYNAGTGNSPKIVEQRTKYANKVYERYSENRGKHKDIAGLNRSKAKQGGG